MDDEKITVDYLANQLSMPKELLTGEKIYSTILSDILKDLNNFVMIIPKEEYKTVESVEEN